MGKGLSNLNTGAPVTKQSPPMSRDTSYRFKMSTTFSSLGQWPVLCRCHARAAVLQGLGTRLCTLRRTDTADGHIM